MILATVILILSLDQFSKFLANKNLLLNHPLPLIKGVLYFTLVHNRGAAFGILKNQVPFFLLTAVLTITLIYFNLKNYKHKQPVIYNLALSLILAGGIGNFIDRIFFGYVIDFIDLSVWPVFNIADSSITIGAVILGWFILIQKTKKESG